MIQDGIVEEAPVVTLAEWRCHSAFREKPAQMLWDVLSLGMVPMGACRLSRLVQAIVSGTRMIFRKIRVIIELAEPPSVIFRK
jgi:hypothetical protein